MPLSFRCGLCQQVVAYSDVCKPDAHSNTPHLASTFHSGCSNEPRFCETATDELQTEAASRQLSCEIGGNCSLGSQFCTSAGL